MKKSQFPASGARKNPRETFPKQTTTLIESKKRTPEIYFH